MAHRAFNTPVFMDQAQILRICCLFLPTQYLKLLSDSPTSFSLHSQNIHAVSFVACFYPFSICYASIHLPSSTQVTIFQWILFLILTVRIKECLSSSEHCVSMLCCFCRTRYNHKCLCLSPVAKTWAPCGQGLNARYLCTSSALYGMWRSCKY